MVAALATGEDSGMAKHKTHSDSHLLALGCDFQRAWDHAARFDEAPAKASLPIAHAANERVMRIVATIMAAPAATSFGFAVKARVAALLDGCTTN
jgi:hypothetical protein